MKKSTNAIPTRSTNTRPRAQRRPQHWWFAHYQAWKLSGIAAEQHCSEQGIRLSSFYNWSGRFQKQSPRQPERAKIQTALTPSPMPFIETVIDSPSPTRAQSVTVNDVTVQFQSGVSPQNIVQWVNAAKPYAVFFRSPEQAFCRLKEPCCLAVAAQRRAVFHRRAVLP